MKSYEAIKLMLEGKKMRDSAFSPGVYWHIKNGLLQSQDGQVRRFGSLELGGNWEEYIEGHDFAWARQQLEAGRVVENQEFPGQRWAGRLEVAYWFTFAHLDSKRWVLAKEQP